MPRSALRGLRPNGLSWSRPRVGMGALRFHATRATLLQWPGYSSTQTDTRGRSARTGAKRSHRQFRIRKNLQPMNHEQLAFFNQQLAGMLKAGLPLEGSLRQISSSMRRGELRDEIELLEKE